MMRGLHSSRPLRAIGTSPELTGRTGRLAAFGVGTALGAIILVAALAPQPVAIHEAGAVEMRAPVVFPVHVTPGMHGVLGQARFHQDAATSSPSRDRLDFVFSGPAKVTGILVSVDDRGMAMMEFAAGINAPTYGFAADDWLIHTSSTGGDIDEHVMFPEGFEVGAGDRVSVVAWLFNDGPSEHWVSPEVIVYYSFLSGPNVAIAEPAL